MVNLSDRHDFICVSRWSVSDESWLSSQYPLLLGDCLRLAIDNELQTNCLQVQAANKEKIEVDQAQMNLLEERFLSTAMVQLQELSDLASQNQRQSTMARRIMWLFLLFPGREPVELTEQIQTRAAACLAAIKPWDAEQLRQALGCAATALTRRMGYNQETRANLLKIFMNTAVRDTTVESRVNREKIGQILCEAFMLELSRSQSDQSISFSSELLRLLKEVRYPSASEVLQVVAESHWSHELRSLAFEALELINPNAASSLTTPTDIPIASMMQESDSGLVLQAIYKNLKSSYIAGRNDPRVPVLQKLLKHEDEKIQLATCFALLKSKFDQSLNRVIPVLEVLADLAVNSRTSCVMKDAVFLLNSLRRERVELSDSLSAACALANEKFIKHHSQSSVYVSYPAC